ncbi:synaptotagmin-9-like [Tubulanus polymorphus]|uniref:synaptotagmin-9-like n=1 Tax=Tubulanus polymorphus TaxID=672921 RepID=UPI003DA37BA2
MLDAWDELLIVIIILTFFVFMILLMVCLLGPDCPLNRHSPCRYPDKDEDRLMKVKLAGIEPTFWAPLKPGEKSPTSITEQGGNRMSEHDLISASVYETYESLKNILPGGEELESNAQPPGTAVFALCVKENLEEGNKLLIRMKHIDNLQPRLYGGQAFIYLKFSLYSRNMSKKSAITKLISEAKTSTKSRTMKTEFFETFLLDKPDLKASHQYVLKVMSYEYDKYSRHEWTGQIEVQLEALDLSEEVAFTETFYSPNEPSRGEVLLSLSYLPTAEKLHIGMVKLRDVKTDHIEGCQLYIKALMVRGKETLQKKRTKRLEPALNTIFNETLSFDVPVAFLDQVAVLILVIGKTSDTSRPPEETIGKCILGEPGYGSGHAHWMEMRNSPRKAVAYWHSLT